MRSRAANCLGLVLVLVFFSIGCAKPTPPPLIKDFGPKKTKAAQGFNVQPDGTSALWIQAANTTESTIIVWGDRQVRTFKEPYGLSAPIQKELYDKPGSYNIYLLDTVTGAKSNSVVFTVE